MNENGYQGYKNYQTWNVALHIDNDRNASHYWQERAEELKGQAGGFDQVCHGVWTEQEAVRFTLANEIEADMRAHPLADTAAMYSDILTHAMGQVDWQEVADSILDE